MYNKSDFFLVLIAGFVIGIFVIVILFRIDESNATFRNTDSKQGNCIIQERVFEPQYRLYCEEKK